MAAKPDCGERHAWDLEFHRWAAAPPENKIKKKDRSFVGKLQLLFCQLHLALEPTASSLASGVATSPDGRSSLMAAWPPLFQTTPGMQK